MFLKPHMHELLLRLDRATLDGGDGWVSINDLRDIPVHVRNYAQSHTWIVGEGDKSQRKYKILPAGRTKLAENAQANLAVMDKLENGFVPTDDEAAEPTVEFVGMDHLIKPGFANGHRAPNSNGIVKSLVSAPITQKKQSSGCSPRRPRAGVRAGRCHPERGLPRSQRPGGCADAAESPEGKRP